jgi:hypothetical protein
MPPDEDILLEDRPITSEIKLVGPDGVSEFGISHAPLDTPGSNRDSHSNQALYYFCSQMYE